MDLETIFFDFGTTLHMIIRILAQEYIEEILGFLMPKIIMSS